MIINRESCKLAFRSLASWLRRCRWNRVNRIRTDYLWCFLPQKKHSRVDVNNSRSNIGSTPSSAKRAAKGLKEPTGNSVRKEETGCIRTQFCVVGTMHHVVGAVFWSLRKFALNLCFLGKSECNIHRNLWFKLG